MIEVFVKENPFTMKKLPIKVDMSVLLVEHCQEGRPPLWLQQWRI
jgi:hypothetical protein